jgi:hypothetical protein
MGSADLQAHTNDGVLYPLCEHIKPGGERCGSPALRRKKLCYYHDSVRRRIPKVNMMVYLWNPNPESDPNYQCDMPYLEDPEALQMAYTQLIHVVTQERIKPDRAKLVLSALHGASLNLRTMEKAKVHREKAATAKKPAGSVPEKEKLQRA